MDSKPPPVQCLQRVAPVTEVPLTTGPSVEAGRIRRMRATPSRTVDCLFERKRFLSVQAGLVSTEFGIGNGQGSLRMRAHAWHLVDRQHAPRAGAPSGLLDGHLVHLPLIVVRTAMSQIDLSDR